MNKIVHSPVDEKELERRISLRIELFEKLFWLGDRLLPKKYKHLNLQNVVDIKQ